MKILTTLISLGLLSVPAQAINITDTLASSIPASASGGVYEGLGGMMNWEMGDSFRNEHLLTCAF